MKRMTRVLLALVLILSITGCNGSKAVEFNRGKWDGDKYYNEYFDITFNKPSDWLKASDDEIEATFAAGLDLIDKSGNYKEIAKQQNVYDFLVVNADRTVSINMLYENLEISNSKNITIEAYRDAGTKLLENNENISYKAGDMKEITLGKYAYSISEAKLVMNGVEYTQFLLLRKVDKYMLVATITITDDTKIEDLLKYFS